MKSSEEMTRDVLARRDKALADRRAKIKRITGIAAGVTGIAAACAAIIIFVIPKNNPAPIITPTGTEAEATSAQTAELIWTGGEIVGSLASKSSSDALNGRAIGEHLFCDISIAEAIDNYKGTDKEIVFALEAGEIASNEFDHSSYDSACYQAEENRYNVLQELTKSFKDTNDISSAEAEIRAMSTSQFVEANQKVFEARMARRIAAFDSWVLNERGKSLLEEFSDFGFNIIADSTSPDYYDYMSELSFLYILSATADDILDFGEAYSGDFLHLREVSESASAYRSMPDIYPHIPEDSKLTEGVSAEFAAHPGQAITVVVHTGYIGEYVDEHEMAYAALGMTEEEFNSAKNLTDEQMDLYYEVLNGDKNYYHVYCRNVINELLAPEEIVELRDYMSECTATLTKERAEEIAQHKEIAYIKLEDEFRSPDIGIMKRVVE